MTKWKLISITTFSLLVGLAILIWLALAALLPRQDYFSAQGNHIGSGEVGWDTIDWYPIFDKFITNDTGEWMQVWYRDATGKARREKILLFGQTEGFKFRANVFAPGRKNVIYH